MTIEDVRKLPTGVYRIHWKSGGSSVGAVGIDSAGKHWMAPANWVNGPVLNYWRKVDRVELIEASFP